MFDRFFEYHSFRIIRRHNSKSTSDATEYVYIVQGYCRKWYWPFLMWCSIDWWFSKNMCHERLERELQERERRMRTGSADEIIKVVV